MNVTEVHTLVGWAKHMLGQRKERKTKKSMLLCPKPTSKPGRERQSMCYDEKMKIGNATYCFDNPC